MKTLTATCRITNPAQSLTVGDDLSYIESDTPVIYDGPCRVQSLSSGEATRTLGDQAVARTAYLVVLERDATELQVGAVVDVYESGDPLLADATLTVRQPITGSLRWERDLLCVSDEGI